MVHILDLFPALIPTSHRLCLSNLPHPLPKIHSSPTSETLITLLLGFYNFQLVFLLPEMPPHCKWILTQHSQCLLTAETRPFALHSGSWWSGLWPLAWPHLLISASDPYAPATRDEPHRLWNLSSPSCECYSLPEMLSFHILSNTHLSFRCSPHPAGLGTTDTGSHSIFLQKAHPIVLAAFFSACAWRLGAIEGKHHALFCLTFCIPPYPEWCLAQTSVPCSLNEWVNEWHIQRITCKQWCFYFHDCL